MRGLQLRKKCTLVAVVLGVLLASALGAQEHFHTFTLSGLAGVGGSLDADGSGLGNLGWQLGFSNILESRTHFGVRLGGVEWSKSDRLDSLEDPSLLYLTLVGEYRNRESSFTGRVMESGVYIGLGGYQLDGKDAAGRDQTRETLGLTLGLMGDLPLTRQLLLRLELQGHWADLEVSQFLALAHLGLAYRF